MKRKLLSLALVVCICFSFPISATAEGDDYIRQAEALKSLGLFLGSDAGFELDREATRVESAVMVVRMLGKEETARSQGNAHPFSDVPEWASAYVGYLYTNNITKGVSEDLFGSAQIATSAQYATYMLRALGYDDSAGDFVWSKALDKMVSLGIISSAQSASFSSGDGVLRGSVVAISYYSLFAAPKGASATLLEKLYLTDKAFSAAQFAEAAANDDKFSMVSNAFGIAKPYPEGDALNSEEVFVKASDAVFMINIWSDMRSGSGSGFFISSDGLAVTNRHVITSAGSAEITMTDGKTYPIESVVGICRDADLALIKVKGSGFPYLELGDPSLLRQAQRIYCIGSPLGFDNTISDGLVSNPSRLYDGYNYIQISAPISPGSSGGALLNEYGQVVGVTTRGYEDGQVNLATPITELGSLSRFSGERSLKYLQAHTNWGYIPVGDSYTESGENDENPVQTIKSDTVTYGTVSDASDVDIYELDIESMSELLISLASDADSSQKIKFELIDPSGKVILKSQHYSGEAFSLAMGHAPKAGKYQLKIYVDGSGDIANVPYDLYWMAHESYEVSGKSYYFSEFEPNDTLEQANYLPNFFAVTGTVSSSSDRDYYKFTLDQESEYVSCITYGIGSSLTKSSLKCEIFSAETNKSVGKYTFASSYLYSMESFSAILDAGDYYIVIEPKSGSELENEFYVLEGFYMD